MKQLFLIFEATIGIAKPLLIFAIIMFILLVSGVAAWFWVDYREVRLRNEVTMQQSICDLVSKNPERVLAEREKLERAKAEYNVFVETSAVKLFLSK